MSTSSLHSLWGLKAPEQAEASKESSTNRKERTSKKGNKASQTDLNRLFGIAPTADDLSATPPKSNSEAAPKKKRGRPRKNPEVEVIEIAPKVEKSERKGKKRAEPIEAIELLSSPPPVPARERPVFEFKSARVDPRPKLTQELPRWPTAEEHGDLRHRHLSPELLFPPKAHRVLNEPDSSILARLTHETKLLVKRRTEVEMIDLSQGDESESFHAIHRSLKGVPCESQQKELKYATEEASMPRTWSHPLLEELSAIAKGKLAREKATETSELVIVDQTDNYQHWSLKYAPQSADEVLGEQNCLNARILRAWLSKLSVKEGQSKPKRRRKSKEKKQGKRKRKSDNDTLDDFIVGDEFVAYNDTSDDDSSEGKPQDYDRFFNGFSNLMILTGPTGSGKTSTVNAVTKELGWKVFEVFPGMGKRSARDLDRYVGDVSRNHTVTNNKSRLQAFFQAKTKPELQNTPASMEHEQSVILIEEVDILYQDEKDFWAGLHTLASTSLRPIIITCHSLRSIPLHSLSPQKMYINNTFQQCLSFSHIDRAMAISFLTLVALCESCHISPSTCENLLEDITAVHPKFSLALPPIDYTYGIRHDELYAQASSTVNLGQALCHMQFICQNPPETEPLISQNFHANDATLLSLFESSERESFADAYLRQSPELIDVKLSRSTCDIYADTLCDDPVSHKFTTEEFTETLLHFDGKLNFKDTLSLSDPQESDRLLRYYSDTKRIIEDNGILEQHIVENQLTEYTLATTVHIYSIFTEYMPFIRGVTAIEDLLAEEQAMSSERSSGTTTHSRFRRSSRLSSSAYHRRYNWSDADCATIANWAFS